MKMRLYRTHVGTKTYSYSKKKHRCKTYFMYLMGELLNNGSAGFICAGTNKFTCYILVLIAKPQHGTCTPHAHAGKHTRCQEHIKREKGGGTLGELLCNCAGNTSAPVVASWSAS